MLAESLRLTADEDPVPPEEGGGKHVANRQYPQ